jgi:hypothetical protein
MARLDVKDIGNPLDQEMTEQSADEAAEYDAATKFPYVLVCSILKISSKDRDIGNRNPLILMGSPVRTPADPRNTLMHRDTRFLILHVYRDYKNRYYIR